MTYALIVLPFLLVAAIVTLATAVRPRFGARMRASVIAAVVLVALTAVFDNVIVGTGIVAYDETRILGLRVGVAPVEDFSYAIVAALALPALWVLLGRRRAR